MWQFYSRTWVANCLLLAFAVALAPTQTRASSPSETDPISDQAPGATSGPFEQTGFLFGANIPLEYSTDSYSQVGTDIGDEAALTVLPAGTIEGAEGLVHRSWCSQEKVRTPVVQVAWVSDTEPEGSQRVEFTKFRSGFERGDFEATQHLSGSRRTATLEGVEPGLRYYWRVLTKADGGWVASRTARFEVPVCPWDKPSSPGE